MTKTQIKKELALWVDSDFPSVWRKNGKVKSWVKIIIPSWNPEYDWIVDNKHAKLRMMQFDEPTLKFDFLEPETGEWIAAGNPTWDIRIEYRVRPYRVVYEWQWYYKPQYVPEKFGYRLTDGYATEKEAALFSDQDYHKFEPSKRKRIG